MKNLYLNILALSVCALSANAQITLTKATHDPVIGDLDKRTFYDSTTVSSVPNSSGTNQLWNFTGMIAQNTFTNSFINPTSAPGNTLFPTATIAQTEVGSTRYEFSRSAGSTFEFVGQIDVVSTETMVFSNTGILRSYPITYGSVSVDSWAALQTSGTGTMSMTGTATISANGTGTVILPNGNVHPNCLQVVENITLTATSGTMSLNGYFKNVFYYEAAKKFPIFEYYYESMGSLKFGSSASTDALLAGVNETRNFTKAVSIYPNPVQNELYISLNGTETPIALQVMDMAGRDVISQEFSNSINVESLEQGLYIVKLNYKDKVLYQRFVKTN